MLLILFFFGIVLIQTYICGNNAVAVDNDDCKGDYDGIFSRVGKIVLL